MRMCPPLVVELSSCREGSILPWRKRGLQGQAWRLECGTDGVGVMWLGGGRRGRRGPAAILAHLILDSVGVLDATSGQRGMEHVGR
eukprot:9269253-Alexandrium_andersonii.AAC.1